MNLIRPFVIVVAFIISLFILILAADYLYPKLTPSPKFNYGVTFSSRAAENLGLNPQVVYRALLDDLEIKNIRLPLYWDNLEPSQNQFNFKLYDQLLDQARGKKVRVVLVVGYKVPRWPECFPPAWTNNLSNPQFQDRVLKLLDQTIKHYQNYPEVVAWQVENEPMLDFGVCRKFDEKFLKQEVDLVKSLDQRPIILTDSGERGWWLSSMKLSDIMGTTLYRSVWDKVFGAINYPIPAIFYPARFTLTKTFFRTAAKDIMISELQAEPWATPNLNLADASLEEQAKLFSLKDFQGVADYAQKTRIKDQYFWGIEWWYLMKVKGDPSYWNFAKELFR